VAILAYGLLRGHWRRTGLEIATPERPLQGTRFVVRMAVLLNALFGLHLLLELTAARVFVIYIPILGGILELGMVYLVWAAVLEAIRTSRPLRREPWLWFGALSSLIPPVISTLRFWPGGQN
jgi:serine/threonine-protein kinase